GHGERAPGRPARDVRGSDRGRRLLPRRRVWNGASPVGDRLRARQEEPEGAPRLLRHYRPSPRDHEEGGTRHLPRTRRDRVHAGLVAREPEEGDLLLRTDRRARQPARRRSELAVVSASHGRRRQGARTITGGNLTLVSTTMGTPYEIEARGRILFLEDTGE